MTHKESEQALAWLRGEIEFECEQKFVIRPGLSRKILVICLFSDSSFFVSYTIYYYEKIGKFWNAWTVLESKDITEVLQFIANYTNDNYRD